MASEFQIRLFEYGDDAGFGRWLDGHYRNHLQYNAVLAARTPAVLIQTWPLLTVEGGQRGLRFWLDAHENWHEAVRGYANVIGIDLSDVDFRDQQQFYQWLDIHGAEHAELDLAFGVA